MPKKKVYPLYNDLVAKFIFGTNENKKFLIDLLASFYNEPKDKFLDIKIRNSVKLDRATIFKKGLELDILIEMPDKSLANLEFYSKYDNDAEIKSFVYITSKFSSELKKGDFYSNIKNIVQINFVKNNYVHNADDLVAKYIVVNDKDRNDSVLPNLFKMYIINIDVNEEIGYNKDINPRFHRWSKLIAAEDEKTMKEIVKGDIILEEAYSKMKEFSNREEVDERFSHEMLIASQHHSELKEAEAKAEEKAKKEAEENAKKETAIKMLKENVDLDIISKVLDLSKEEILKLKDN